MVSRGTIFGWGLREGSDDDLLYHVGVVLEVANDPKDHIVIHYGASCENKIRIEKLSEAVKRSAPMKVVFNTEYPVSEEQLKLWNDTPHRIAITHRFEGQPYSVEYNSCQNFIRDAFDYRYPTQSELAAMLKHANENRLVTVGIIGFMAIAFSIDVDGLAAAAIDIAGRYLKSNMFKWNPQFTLDVSGWDRDVNNGTDKAVLFKK